MRYFIYCLEAKPISGNTETKLRMESCYCVCSVDCVLRLGFYIFKSEFVCLDFFRCFVLVRAMEV